MNPSISEMYFRKCSGRKWLFSILVFDSMVLTLLSVQDFTVEQRFNMCQLILINSHFPLKTTVYQTTFVILLAIINYVTKDQCNFLSLG